MAQRRRREYKRIIKSLKAEVSTDNHSVTGSTVRMSEAGLFVRTQKPFNEGVNVAISISLPDGSRCNLSGVVRHSRRANILHMKNGMGIEITRRDLKYMQFIDDLKRIQGH